MTNNLILEQYSHIPDLQLSMIINCKLRELYAYKKAYAIAYNILFNFPVIINISLVEKDIEIEKLKCLAAFRKISVKVTEENVNVTLSDVTYIIREIFERNVMMVNSSNFDPFSNTYESNRSKSKIVAQLKDDLNRLIARLDEESIGLKRNKN